MNLSRCEMGHFFDKEKYPVCPHCAGGSAADDSLTTVFTEDVTEPLDPIQQSNVLEQYNSAPPLPIADLPVSDIPVSMDYGVNDYGMSDSVTIPLGNEPGNIFDNNNLIPVESTVDSDDDDHTIGFFGDDFFSAPPVKKQEVVTAPVVNKTKPVNKVSTPCVGWLVALSGSHIGTDFRLKVGKNFVGRSPQMDIALVEDKSVSRDRHAIVVYEPKEHLYLVQPGEASTLVYRNDEVVLSPVKLESYDVITVGDVNLLFIPLCNKQFNWSSLFEEMKRKTE